MEVSARVPIKERIKVSYHLSSDVLEELESFWFSARRETKEKITRQEIVDLVLRSALANPAELRIALGIAKAS